MIRYVVGFVDVCVVLICLNRCWIKGCCVTLWLSCCC